MSPIILLVAAGLLLLLALFAFWRSLNAFFAGVGRGGVQLNLADLEAQAGALNSEKHALLRAIKDLEFEHAVGKISDDDFSTLNETYRSRAREVLKALDTDLGPYLEQARAQLKELEARGDEATLKLVRSGVSTVCAKCGTINDGDARYCKSCATLLSATGGATAPGDPSTASGQGAPNSDGTPGAEGST